MYYVVVVFYVLVCLLLLVVVLLQQGKGGDIAAAFGGSSSQTAFGARAGATVLTRATAVLGTLFMVAAFALGIMSKGGTGGSVVGGVEGPTQTAPAVPALPTNSPPPGAGGSGSTPAPTPTATPQTTPPAGGAGR
jgi:preprotein translocase subunit SecG